MAKTDPLELHRKFVGKMVTGVAFAIAGIAAGYAVTAMAPNAESDSLIAPAASVDNAVRSTTRIERSAIRNAPGTMSASLPADRHLDK